MDTERKKPVYDAGKATWFWISDQNDAIHGRYTMSLDHEVSGSELLEAWKKTLRVYPLLDLVPNRVDGHLLFFEPDGEPKVMESEEPTMPGTELAGKRGISISYYGDTITLLAFHSVLDGNGMFMVMRTLVYYYCCIHFGRTFEVPGAEFAENREPVEYYKPYMSHPLGDYTPQAPYTFPENTFYFSEPNMVTEGPGKIVVGTLGVPVDDFIALCKRHKANPTAMLCIILARASYGLHEDERRDMLYHLTLDLRPALDIRDSIAHCSSAAMVGLSRDEAMAQDLAPAATRLRADLNAQRGVDYVKSHVALLRTYDMIASACSGVVSYIGRIDLGECQEHVTGMSIVNNASNILNMVQLKDEFLMYCQFGLAAQDYMTAIAAELEKFGVPVRTVQYPAQVIPERRA